MAKSQKYFLVVFVSLFIAGCASVPYVPPVSQPMAVPGIYHRVIPGETLWRISKMYNVDLEEIARVNRIADATRIEKGQMILIPRVEKRPACPVISDSEDFIWPIKGRVISGFGQTYSNMINKGINIAPYGDASVVASRGGKVIFYSENFGNFGRTIIIDHGDGLSSVYARNSQVFIKLGDSVAKGMTISRAGSAGRDKSTYLHFEIRKGHIPQNPNYYLP
jgi:septal ring factor EnvC (AmiA/AmiB activator)